MNPTTHAVNRLYYTLTLTLLSHPNVPVKGVEPLTSWFVAKHSIRLSYTGIKTVDLCYSTPYQCPQTVGLR